MSVMTEKTIGRNAAGSSFFEWRRVLLLCGMMAAVLYVVMDAAAALLYDGYSYRDQTISELSAIGAPTRTFWLPLGLLYSSLVVAFGLGLWNTASDRSLRIVAALVFTVGAMGFVAWPFAPMHQREVLAAGGGTLSDTMHLVLGGVSSVLFIVMLALGATLGSKRFRIYSVVTLVTVLAFGAYMGTQTANVGENEPTPWLGIAERVAIFAPMIWMGVLGLTLRQRPERDSRTDVLR
jgi:hypothetical protein